jgi:hypothetical protein
MISAYDQLNAEVLGERPELGFNASCKVVEQPRLPRLSDVLVEAILKVLLFSPESLN